MSIFFTTAADKSLITAAGKSFKRQSLMTYTLLVTLCEGVSSANIKRTSTVNPSAETNITITTTSAIPVYYGDVVEITPTVMTNYDICGTWPQTFNIIENTSIEIDADYNPPLQTQLLPLILNNDGGYRYLKEDRRATVFTKVTNPNNIKVNVYARLFDVSASSYREVSSSPAVFEVAANSSATISFDDYNNTLGFSDWADPARYIHNCFMIAMYCTESTYSGNYLPSRYKFASHGNPSYSFGVDDENKATKVDTPGVSAKYSASAGSNPYNITCTISTGWAFPCKCIVIAPNGTTEFDIEARRVRAENFFRIPIQTDSLDAVVRVQFIDMSTFGFEPSDEVTFNLADANNTDDDNTGDTR